MGIPRFKVFPLRGGIFDTVLNDYEMVLPFWDASEVLGGTFCGHPDPSLVSGGLPDPPCDLPDLFPDVTLEEQPP